MLSDATPVFLLSPWKPILIFFVFIAWGWLVSKHLEKDARSAHLNSIKWNSFHTSAAFVGLAIMLFGVNFYFAFPIGIIVILSPILVYWKVRNDVVAEVHKFQIGTGSIKETLEKRKIAKASRQVKMKFNGYNGAVRVPDKDDALIDTYLKVEELISEALSHRASRLDLQLTSSGMMGVYLVDGVPTKQESISADAGAKVLAFIKETSGADPSDVRRRQTGSFDVSTDATSAHVNLTSSGSSSTHIVRLEFDRTESVLRTWESIGLLPKQRELLDQLKDDSRRHGIVLIGGEKQSGITTTGYSILSQHDAYLCNIVTLEKEVIATLEGITHNTCSEESGDYATQLQTIIRRDPEVILATDLTEAKAAKTASKPGRDGPLIFITMSATSMSDLLSKWAGMVADPRQSFNSLQTVVYQKLVRRLCENCRVSYKPTPDLVKQGLPVDSVEQLYREGGEIEHKNKVLTCPVCNGSGYMGQVGVFETMFLDNETRKHLIAGDLKAAMAHARRNKQLIRLQEAAWQKVAAGDTSLEEFGRVNAKKKSKSKSTTSSK
ncbi:MAG: ATPase, T2SS/T4P/T4SS family [Phycisphaerales bacterium]|jgi:type IV pilus assembly protein PilB|nr:ATPase, T2SS/T4P/T4SS family [Phycisphaerales bacterium]